MKLNQPGPGQAVVDVVGEGVDGAHRGLLLRWVPAGAVVLRQVGHYDLADAEGSSARHASGRPRGHRRAVAQGVALGEGGQHGWGRPAGQGKVQGTGSSTCASG